MRLPKLSSFAFLLDRIGSRYFLSERQKRYRNYFAARNTSRASRKSRPLIAMSGMEDMGYFALFASLVTQMRACGPLRVDILVTRSLSSGSSHSLRARFWAAVISNALSDRVWKQLYFSVADRLAYRSAAWMAPWTEYRIFRKVRRIVRELDSIDALAALTVRGIQIGDLVIDSYIRFKPSPSVDLRDPYLGLVIRQALRDLEKAFRYFTSDKPDIYFTGYTTYAQHGVAARAAVACGIRVLSFGNFQEFSKDITRADLYHTKASVSHAAHFSCLPDRAEKLAAADRILSARVAGQMDISTAYMKASAWHGDTEIPPDVRGSLVIFLHDFYDSVHVYPTLLFHDFWSWVCFTINTLKRHNIPFFIKPHPNQIGASDEAFAQLCRKYPDLPILPPKTNNRQLAENGMAGVVTVYGTISAEMAYLGIPTISCGDNPHASFPFCRVARSREEYESMLTDTRPCQISRADMQDQARAFFYMHHINAPDEDLDLRDRSIKLRTNIWYKPDRPAEDILTDFEEFETAQSLKSFCKNLMRDLTPAP